jgi:hypothetical protein
VFCCNVLELFNEILEVVFEDMFLYCALLYCEFKFRDEISLRRVECKTPRFRK